jgi:hypothetical protein
MRDFMDIVERGNGSKILWTTIVLVTGVYVVKGIWTRDWRHD